MGSLPAWDEACGKLQAQSSVVHVVHVASIINPQPGRGSRPYQPSAGNVSLKFAFVYVCVYVYIYIYMYMYVYVCMYVCMYVYIYIYIYETDR